MERVKPFMEELYTECKENNVSCLAIVGDKDNFDVAHTEDLEEVGENIYFAITNDKRLYKVVAEAVRIASGLMDDTDTNNENEE